MVVFRTKSLILVQAVKLQGRKKRLKKMIVLFLGQIVLMIY